METVLKWSVQRGVYIISDNLKLETLKLETLGGWEAHQNTTCPPLKSGPFHKNAWGGGAKNFKKTTCTPLKSGEFLVSQNLVKLIKLIGVGSGKTAKGYIYTF